MLTRSQVVENRNIFCQGRWSGFEEGGAVSKLLLIKANSALVAGTIVAVLFSLVGAFYYLRIVKLMYFDEPESDAAITPGGDVGFLISANGMAVLILGIFPQTLMTLCFYALH